MEHLPTAFARLRDFVRNDLKQIRKLAKKPPVYAVGLLIAIATEALSQLEGRDDDAVFAEDLLHRRHDVPLHVGRVLFDAVRHGLAHVYDTKIVMLGSEEVTVVLSWSQRRHLTVAVEEWEPEKERRRGICLNLGTMWSDLDDYFTELAEQLRLDGDLRQRVEANAAKQTRKAPQGPALQVWRELLQSREDQ